MTDHSLNILAAKAMGWVDVGPDEAVGLKPGYFRDKIAMEVVWIMRPDYGMCFWCPATNLNHAWELAAHCFTGKEPHEDSLSCIMEDLTVNSFKDGSYDTSVQFARALTEECVKKFEGSRDYDRPRT